MEQVILDTETTGLSPESGHRLIEIGAIVLENRRITGKVFHQYLDPERDIDPGAVQVHGITYESLRGKPKFKEILKDFLSFIQDSELIIHNAPFDVGFLNHELKLAGHKQPSLEKMCKITDTLALARKIYPGQRNSLDALCKRLKVDNSQRQWHGALLDAELLAKVYLSMTGGQMSLFDETVNEPPHVSGKSSSKKIATLNESEHPLTIVNATAQETNEHQAYLELLKKTGGQHFWTED
jgi:DNA polymerase III subunit epsilon